jgi:hypothetical protein
MGHDGYTCTCGQRFRLPRAGKLRFLPETETESLFWVPEAEFFLNVHQILALPELQGIDFGTTAIELPLQRLRAAAELAAVHGDQLAQWHGRSRA